MKMILAALVVMLVVSGTAWAQTIPASGPAYYRVENTLDAGTKVLLNTNFRVNPTPRYQMYVISDEAKFWVSGYRYTDGVWTKVFPAGTDTAVYWHTNIALPITEKVDLLVIDSSLSDGGVDLVVYK